MLESFYKYLINQILADNFKAHPAKKGEHYSLIIENEENRHAIINAVKQSSFSRPIHIEGIYEGNISDPDLDQYDTVIFTPNESDKSADLIVADIDSGNEYLPTLRNAVNAGRKYEDYATFFILSNYASVETLSTSCIDLQSKGQPLNAHEISKCIAERIDNTANISDNERAYLQFYLDKIVRLIDNDTCDLFDFEDIMSVLQKKTLKGSFNLLDYFPDESIYGIFVDPNIKNRVFQNDYYFDLVRGIMSNLDEDSRKNKLTKIFDDKMVSRILDPKVDWKQIDIEEILNSVNLKAATSSLLVEEITYLKGKNIELEESNILSRTFGKNKKTATHTIICSNEPKIIVKVRFNKPIKREDITSSFHNISVYDKTMTIELESVPASVKVGHDDNIHDFIMTKLNVSKPTFSEISSCYKLTIKGDVSISVPEDVDKIKIGNGTVPLEVGPLTLPWSEDDYLIIESNDTNEGKIKISLQFDGKVVAFAFNFDNQKIICKTSLDIFELIWKKKATFRDARYLQTGVKNYAVISNNEDECSTRLDFRILLNLEQQMIDGGNLYLTKVEDGKGQATYAHFDDNIIAVGDRLFSYFREKNTIPSLCYIDEELEGIYAEYLMTVQHKIAAISNNRRMTEDEYALTRLGVVEFVDGTVWLSPFSPINIAFLLEFKYAFDTPDCPSKVLQLINSNYLIPYLTINSVYLQPRIDGFTEELKTWICYEPVDSSSMNHSYNITTRMVKEKVSAFIDYFQHLFSDKDCPVIINTFGLPDDSNIIKGLVQFIISQYVSKGVVQRIELHEYVDNLLKESFFERLNRLASDDLIKNELELIGQKIEGKDKYTSREIIHLLFSRVSFYKHYFDSSDLDSIGYCHVSFYQMKDSIASFSRPKTEEFRTELSMGGLISIPSTNNNGCYYQLGFGSNGVKDESGFIYPIAVVMNELYANEYQRGAAHTFLTNSCLAKKYEFKDQKLLNKIYEQSNWVTFLNPEVDIDFFYKQDLYIVHYTDQYTINAKYDSITVTKHIDRYQSLLMNSLTMNVKGKINLDVFNHNMLCYFNSINGSWLLDVVKKQEFQVREKMSIVATVIAMRRFLRRNEDIIWIPLSLEEILRISGSIGLPKDYIFSAKSLNVKGIASDDLLFIGLDATNPNDIKLIFYPVEVKYSKKDIHAIKGEAQVYNTYKILRYNLFGNPNFVKKVYRTFFASQLLTNADKLHANMLLTEEEWKAINNVRFELLNAAFSIQEGLPIKEMGFAALVAFNSAANSISTDVIEDVPVCHINFNTEQCMHFIADSNHKLGQFLDTEFTATKVYLDRIEEFKKEPIDEKEPLPSMEEEEDGEDENTLTLPLVTVEPEPSKTDNPEEVPEEPDIESEIPWEDQPQTPGIVLHIGEHKYTHTPIYFQPNNTSVVSHPNMGIIGTMGTGKTQFARSIIAQFSKEGEHNVNQTPIGMLVFDYKGDYNDEEFLNSVNGECYSTSLPFNPLTLVVNEKVKKLNLPSITADRIADSLQKAFNLGNVQRNVIKDVIIETYADAGIFKDSSTWNKPVPTMSRVVEKYFENHDAKDTLYGIFGTLRDYPMFTEDTNECVSLFEWLDGVKVIDLTIFEDSVKRLIVSLILDLFYAEMKQWGGSMQKDGYRELRAMILVDEAHQFLKMKFAALRKIISEGRMFGVGMILSTQNLSDFKSDEDYSQFIMSWVIHHVNNVTKNEIASIFGATNPYNESYIKYIADAQIFESLCKIGHEVIQMVDLPYFRLVEEDSRFNTQVTPSIAPAKPNSDKDVVHYTVNSFSKILSNVAEEPKPDTQ